MAHLLAYSSGNPVIDQLFAREFQLRQANQQADDAAAQREVQRQQIMAQSQLAQSQLQANQQQQAFQNRLAYEQFKDKQQEGAERNALYSRGYDIQEKALGLGRVPTELERRKQNIIDANSNAVNDAARANALYKIQFEQDLADAKKSKVASVLPGLWGGLTEADLDNPSNPVRKKIAKDAFDKVYRNLLAEKGGTIQSLVPDPETFTFRPVQFDETGKAIAPTVPSPGPKPDITDPTQQWDPYGNPLNPAALGAGAAPEAVTVPNIRIPQPGGGYLEMSPSDAAEVQRQLRSAPPEQRGILATTLRNQLLQSGRAKISGPSWSENLPRYYEDQLSMPVF